VVVLDNLSTGKFENIADIAHQIDWIEGDILDIDLINRILPGVSAVCHQAALPSVPRSLKNPVETNNVNVSGTLQLLWACREHHIPRFVMASSSSVYGDVDVLPKHENLPLLPLSPYAFSKAAGEHYCRLFTNHYGITTVCLRYFNVFGPRQNPESEYAAAIPKFINRLRKGLPPEIYGDGEQTRDFTYVANVVQANMLALSRPPSGHHVYNIGSGSRISINLLVNHLQILLSANRPPVYLPERPGDVKHSEAEISLAQRELHYTVSVGLAAGLAETVKWFSA